MYTCTKRYGSELGLSSVFRQHRAKSHCAQLHGYALAFEFEFACAERDENGWVLDFGSLKALKNLLTHNFDHTTLVAEDDPALPDFEGMQAAKLINLRVHPRVGCEAFAKFAFDAADQIARTVTKGRAFCLRATVAEHGGNSATYKSDHNDAIAI